MSTFSSCLKTCNWFVSLLFDCFLCHFNTNYINMSSGDDASKIEDETTKHRTSSADFNGQTYRHRSWQTIHHWRKTVLVITGHQASLTQILCLIIGSDKYYIINCVDKCVSTCRPNDSCSKEVQEFVPRKEINVSDDFMYSLKTEEIINDKKEDIFKAATSINKWHNWFVDEEDLFRFYNPFCVCIV